ncbi:hypothetical protein L6452_32645 [Arctium lappa]|uniref:Uncharacterized protein n=1 Tax=Arctium lappa TaxID=4217 RepID=A0ACB8Z5T1_ARCLA|nr:hypothetical protein L6452_32645 [Arctium lappa]
MKKNSFSNYMNTADNPLDEDGNEIEPKSKGSTSNNPPVVKKLIDGNNQGSTEGNNAIGVKVELRQQPPLNVSSDVKDDETSELGIMKDSSIKGNNAIGMKVKLREKPSLTVASDVEVDKASKLRITKDASMEDDDFMSIPRPVPSSSTIILDSDKPIPRKITKRIVEGMKGITLNEGLKERIDGTRGRLRNNDTKAKDQMKRANKSVLDAGIEDGVRIPKREEDMKLMDDKIGLLVAAKYDTEKLLESLIEKYHGNETFKKYKGILGDIFKYESKDKETSNDDCRESDNKMNECEADAMCKDIVLSQVPQSESFAEMDIHQTPISQFWYSQTLFRVCDETALKSLSNKKAIMEIQEIPGPNFDMGYNPIENVQPISVVKATKMDKGKGICIEAEPPLKKFKILGTKYNHERASRRTISFGDHLRSPYVRRAVDMKVTTEEKRIHAWAITTMGGEL